MARIHELMNQVGITNPELATALRSEYDALSGRRAFGLNFERHTPESVELPGKAIQINDKVHVLPNRNSPSDVKDKRLWIVSDLNFKNVGREVLLTSGDGKTELRDVALANVIVVAEFRDPIYPGLTSTGRITTNPDKPFHVVINAENYHALELLTCTSEGSVDAIYIDPPYNTGAKDWKYNNDYVEADDLYRHSKWLAFIERRLLIAKRLLNPAKSSLIVTIDEKEYLRLGLLLEQVFPEARIQMVTSVINRFGSSRKGQFSRVEEYIFFVLIGESEIQSTDDNMLHNEGEVRTEVRWKDLRRGGEDGKRAARPNLFYPIFVEERTGKIVGAGESLPAGEDRSKVPAPAGCIAVWPLSTSGVEMRWGLAAKTLSDYLSKGYVKWSKINEAKLQQVSISHLGTGAIDDIQTGKLSIKNRDENGSVIVEYDSARDLRPMSLWNRTSHSAGDHGSALLGKILPGRRFPFPKSLYAVEDALRFVIGDKKDALIVDFFAGSGTTAHAVMRLNKQDGGNRRSISITNNEVSAEEQKSLLAEGLRPGDPDWERWGICDFITKPRIEAVIRGLTPEGQPISGEYRFRDEFPMREGFDENAEFLTLTYQDHLATALLRNFKEIAPLLWLRAGAVGDCIADFTGSNIIGKKYAILADFDELTQFANEISSAENVTHVFCLTGEDRLFESAVACLRRDLVILRVPEILLQNSENNSRLAN